MNRRLLLGLVAVSLLANAFLLVRVVDMGVTSTYQGDELAHRKKQVWAASLLIPQLAPGMTRAEVIGAAKACGLKVIDKGADGIYVDEFLFRFSKGKLASVSVD